MTADKLPEHAPKSSLCPYLIQVLKKSNFWFHNSSYYSDLRALVENCTVPASAYTRHPVQDEEEHENNAMVELKNSNKKFKIESKVTDSEDWEESEEEKQNNLIKFVQLQQEELCKKNKDFNDIEGASADQGQSLDLSASSNSLLSAFSKLSSKNVHSSNEFSTESSLSLNSDLEMEVASTLVGMKFFKRT